MRQGDDFIRVATNVIHDGQRAIGTKLASTGAAYAAIKSGNAFYGQVDILGTPYLTGYEPMFNANKEVIGAWYVGYQADLNELEQSISQANIAISQMDGVTQQNASLVVQASNAAQELEQQANTLAAAVSAFSIDPALDISVAPQKITG